MVPTDVRELYVLWLARRRYRLNLEHVEEDEFDELVKTTIDQCLSNLEVCSLRNQYSVFLKSLHDHFLNAGISIGRPTRMK